MPLETDGCFVEDLRPLLHRTDVRQVLSPAVYNPTAERLEHICRQYQTEPAWRILGYQVAGTIAGCLGLELGTNQRAVIRHIAVSPEQRGQGIGRVLIRHALAIFALQHLTAETDHEAVEFYRKCGFSIRSLGEIYPGTERFMCSYRVEHDERTQPR